MMTETKSGAKPAGAGGTEVIHRFPVKHPLLWVAFFLFLTLALLFHKSFDTHYVHYSNDGRLGLCVAEESHLPELFFGAWSDLNWLGNEGLVALPSFTSILRWVSGPFWYSRLLPPATLLFVGLCACFCFRKLRLAPMACILGGLAAGLNSDFFSTSCWGVASQVVGFGAMFVAIGWMYDAGNTARNWLMVLVAGMAVGFGIMEAYDIGALFSLYVAAFILYRSLFMDGGEMPGKIAKGVVRVSLVAIVAALVSSYALSGLIGTQVVGVAATQQDKETREKTWPFATQFSLPKVEALQIVIPGIFGYRNQWHMYDDDQPKADQYWGKIGEDPQIADIRKELSNPDPNIRQQAREVLNTPGLLRRLIGTGFYAGIPIVVIALWGVFQSFRKAGAPYTPLQRKSIKFWFGALVVALLFAFGKYAPFYQFFYALPYASTIRNPAKFMHIFNWSLIILFAYGVHGLYLNYFKEFNVRAKLGNFDKKWLLGCFIVAGLGFIGWVAYADHRAELVSYLQTTGIPSDDVASVAKFSISSVAWFGLFMLLTALLLLFIFKGKFSGQNAALGAGLLGLLLAVDLIRSDVPWIVYWDVDYKYAIDPIMQMLAKNPDQHRVTFLPPISDNPYQKTPQYGMLNNAYGSSWKQHLFPYLNIQSADDVQEPRVGADKQRFLSVVPTFKFWQLSNTRYFLGPGGDFVKEALDPTGKHFRILQNFTFEPRIANPQTMVDFLAKPDPNGPLGVIEFEDALPRAKLFSNWQVDTNDDEVIHAVANPAFDLGQSVFVSGTNVPAALPANTNQSPGTVDITLYKSKLIELSADAKTPAILFLSERYNPKWRVTVDGHPAELLRCDFITRGVYLAPGKHQVVFRFVSSLKTFYISVISIAVGLLLICFLSFTRNRGESQVEMQP